MSKHNATKKTLMLSLLSMVLCVSMLVGSTFAWFTDTATTAVNKIQAGTLDVELWQGEADAKLGEEALKWVAKDGRAQENILWEPGCSYNLESFRIKNNGNLALKYKVVITGLVGNAKLLEAIDFTVTVDGDLGAKESDSAATVTTVAELNNFEGFLAPNDVTGKITIIGTMKETAGNEFMGEKIEGISITVYATQDTVESDSEGNQYDKDATYKGSQDFTSGSHTLNKGGVVLATDERPIAVFASGSDTDVTITGGYYDGGSGRSNVCVAATNGATVTIKDGTFTVGGDANGLGNAVIYSVGGNIVIEGGFFYTNYSYNGKYYVLNQNNSNPGTITVKGGTFVNYDPSKGDDNVQPTNFVAEGYSVISETKANGDVWYTVVKGTGVVAGTQEELNTGITDSTTKDVTVKLPTNSSLTLDNGIANEGSKARDITFKGDGTQTVDVITNAVTAEGGELNYQRGSTFTFENLVIQAGEGNFDGVVCDELTYVNCTIKGKLTLYGKATFINCTFENDMANQYSIWTWGGTDVTFTDCTFNTNGKAILLYGRATAEKPTNLVVNNCTFNDRNNGSAGKAAIEIGNDYNATYTLTINNISVNGFSAGKNTDSKLWANKNSMDAAHLSVTIDGTKVQ